MKRLPEPYICKPKTKLSLLKEPSKRIIFNRANNRGNSIIGHNLLGHVCHQWRFFQRFLNGIL